MKRYIFFLSLVLILTTACAERPAKVIEANVEKDFESLEEKYLKEIEKNPDEKTYIKLADLYRDENRYYDELNILVKATDEIEDSREVDIRSLQYKRFEGDWIGAKKLIDKLLEKEFDERIIQEAFKLQLQYWSMDNVDSYYINYMDRIEKMETKILAYKVSSNDSSYRNELKEELVNSGNEAAYALVLDKEVSNKNYEEVEILLPGVKELNGGDQVYNIYSRLVDLKDMYVEAYQIGNFINKDKKDLALMYKKDYNEMDRYILLMDGSTGEVVIDEIMGDYQPEFIGLDIFEEKGKLDQLAVSTYSGASATSGKSFYLCKFDGDSYEANLPELEDDIEVSLLDGFKIKVESKSLKISYIIDIPGEDRPAYVEDGQFDHNGKVMEEGEVWEYHDGYILRDRGLYRDTIGEILGFGGTFAYNTDRLAYGDRLYNVVDGKLVNTHFSIQNSLGMDENISYEDGIRTIVYSIENLDEDDSETISSLYGEHLGEDDFKLDLGDQIISMKNVSKIIDAIGPGEIEILEEVDEMTGIYKYENKGLAMHYLEKDGGKELYNQFFLVDRPGVKTLRGLEVGIDQEKLEKLYGHDEDLISHNDELVYMYKEDLSSGQNTYPLHMNLCVVVDKNTKKVLRYYYVSVL